MNISHYRGCVTVGARGWFDQRRDRLVSPAGMVSAVEVVSALRIVSPAYVVAARLAHIARCALAGLLALTATCGWAAAGGAAPARIAFEVLRELPHDSGSFTQGLLIDGAALVETSGLYGKSFISRYPVAGEGRSLRRALPKDVFAEGLAKVGDAYWVLTWREGKLLRFAERDLRPLPGMLYTGEGWGLAYDGRHLVMSDGSDQLTFRDPKDFAPLRQLTVRARGRPLRNLNELEVAEGYIWANVWHTPLIVAIDPQTGDVVGELNLEQLVRRHAEPWSEAVLNGIAFDRSSGTYWITGKYWPARYQLRLRWPTPEPAL